MMKFNIHKRGFWFRIFGWGASVINTKDYGMLFSERYGYQKRIRFGNWKIILLKPRHE